MTSSHDNSASLGRVTGASIIALDHVQLAMPAGREADARAFYGGVLGLTEVPKPPVLAARGGCWFEHGAIHVHLGVEDEFRPARKAHIAFIVRGLDTLLEAGNVSARWSNEIEHTRRCHIDDPFGNRLELIDADFDANVSGNEAGPAQGDR